MGLLSTKWLLTYWYDLLQSLITGVVGQRCKVPSFLPNFSTSSRSFHICKYKPLIKPIELKPIEQLLSHILLVKLFIINFEPVFLFVTIPSWTSFTVFYFPLVRLYIVSCPIELVKQENLGETG